MSLKLFSEKGYDKVTVDEIVKKSGTSKGSFYQHFSSKSDIFLVGFTEVHEYYCEVFHSFPDDTEIDVVFWKKKMKVIYWPALDKTADC
ncbi:TetR/AcrR family transcriptional regulator [Peribacillus simplex]|uniref:helix-turn-helix domain-containing protein n=1 Tax=Peribacillus simplex TaxID=1478 RepID=UPI000F62C2FB|nr:helix-turn-helix domain-containing protein [Peribacillus simplex]RRN70054.1 TetR/AcrR family transcriptional regulator [Peribacillus simplex]